MSDIYSYADAVQGKRYRKTISDKRKRVKKIQTTKDPTREEILNAANHDEQNIISTSFNTFYMDNILYTELNKQERIPLDEIELSDKGDIEFKKAIEESLSIQREQTKYQNFWIYHQQQQFTTLQQHFQQQQQQHFQQQQQHFQQQLQQQQQHFQQQLQQQQGQYQKLEIKFNEYLMNTTSIISEKDDRNIQLHARNNQLSNDLEIVKFHQKKQGSLLDTHNNILNVQQSRLLLGQLAYCFEYQFIIRILSLQRRKELGITTLLFLSNNLNALNKVERNRFKQLKNLIEKILPWETLKSSLEWLKTQRICVAHPSPNLEPQQCDRVQNILFSKVEDQVECNYLLGHINSVQCSESIKSNCIKILQQLARFSHNAETPLFYEDLKMKKPDDNMRKELFFFDIKKDFETDEL